MMDRDLRFVGRDVLKIFRDPIVGRELALHLELQNRRRRELFCDRTDVGDRLRRVLDLSLAIAETVASRYDGLTVDGDQDSAAIADLIEFLEIGFGTFDSIRPDTLGE